jgi:hypothetical protein
LKKAKKNMQKNQEIYMKMFLFPLHTFQKLLSKVVLQIEVGSYHNSLVEKEKCNFSIFFTQEKDSIDLKFF